MTAARYRPGDGAIRVDDVPRPEPAPGEVLVAVAVSAVNPTDWKARATGDAAEWIVPNQDGAGVVVAVGDGVPDTRVGERVWVWQAQWQRSSGTAAEYVAVPDARAVRLPDGVSFDLGAGLGIPAMTAHRCLFADGPLTAADHVLVHGGAGAVGHAAIELARRAGAQVVATVSSPEKGALAEAAGAQLVVDYLREDVAERVRSWAPGGVVRIVEVDLARNLATDAAVLAPGGAIVVYSRTETGVQPPRELMSGNAHIDFMLVYTIPDTAKAAAVADITRALEAGALTALPGPRFGLAETAAAHDAVEQGATGKVLIDVAALDER
ncbi:NADPH:quinone reductase [Baekduia alba]|uniref:NADPH:quinone reductase n=1 Tax=Baekduia alba TaxID=2997333 RepID=UPI0032C48B44